MSCPCRWGNADGSRLCFLVTGLGGGAIDVAAAGIFWSCASSCCCSRHAFLGTVALPEPAAKTSLSSRRRLADVFGIAAAAVAAVAAVAAFAEVEVLALGVVAAGLSPLSVRLGRTKPKEMSPTLCRLGTNRSATNTSGLKSGTRTTRNLPGAAHALRHALFACCRRHHD